jgi:ATP-dependent helicase HrpA
MSNDVNAYELRDKLNECLIKDRHRFGQQLNRLLPKRPPKNAAASSGGTKPSAARKPDDQRKLLALAQKINDSIDKVEERRAALPSLSWPDLPVVERLDDLKEAIREHQVVVVAGETGSGKTTQLPKICLSLGRGVHGMIGHTQPRRLAARAVANRIAEECQSELGDIVGYRIRFNDQVSHRTLVKLMTDGMLLAEIQQDPYLNQYDTLIIDEAHERSLNIDFLLGYLKQLLPRRPDLKVLITSATIDHQRFADHFNNAPFVEVSGRTFPVTVHYRPADEERELSRQLEETLLEIEATERRDGRPSACDVLVFLSGERDIRDAHRHLKKCEFRDTEFLPLYSRLTQQEQHRVFSSHRGRRVVLSTNVAETSLTVPGIRYVIDAGTARISRYSVQSKVQRLPIEPISQASAEQRKGRSGRIMPGDCYRLYSEEDFLSRPAFTDPEIQRTNLAAVILQMADQGLGDLDAFPFIDVPDGRFVRDGYRLLEELGAWREKRLTVLGKKLARLPLDPRLGRMLLAAADLGGLEEVLIIVSALAVQDPRDRPQEVAQQADQAHQPFCDKDSDFLFFLNLWRWSEAQRDELSRNQYERALKKAFLSPLRVREWRDVHRQLLLVCRDLKLDVTRTQRPATFEQIHRALLTGLLGNVLKRTEEGEWLSARNRKPALWPGSSLSKTKASWLVAAEQVETSRLFARVLAKIEPEWIEKQAGDLVKRSYLEPPWSKKRGAVMAKEQVSLFGLIISSGKRVQYGHHDPMLARELLIREGLVEGGLSRTPEFVRVNRSLIDTLQEVENKLRRRDLLADEEKQYGFYDRHLPDGLLTLNALESWLRRSASIEQKNALLMDEAFLIDADISADEREFPETLDVDGAMFELEYQFSPTGSADGITLIAPVQALTLLTQVRLEWLVPGLLREKIESLIRGLPKARRRHFVPVPDFVRALMDTLCAGASKSSDEPLLAAMTRELQRMSGVRIEQEEWPLATLPPHLRFHIRVIDGDAILAQGQELDALQQQFSDQASRSVDAVIAQPDVCGRDWVFGSLAAMNEQRHQGVLVRVWPALRDDGEQVSLNHFSDPDEALFCHGWALARLLLFKLSLQRRELEQKMNRLPAFQKIFAKDKALRNAVLLRLVYDHFLGGTSEAVVRCAEQVRDEQAFARMFDAGRAAFLPAAEKQLQQWESMLTDWRTLTQKLDKNFPLAWAHAHADIKDQLAELFTVNWLYQVPGQWLSEYPRYLKAIAQRLDKIGGQISRDRAQALALQPLYLQLARRAGGKPIWQWPTPLLQYRYLLEEYRVSLFAQQLGTRFPVSEKRLRQQWELC